MAGAYRVHLEAIDGLESNRFMQGETFACGAGTLSTLDSLSDLTGRSEGKTDLRQFSNSFEANSGSIKRKRG